MKKLVLGLFVFIFVFFTNISTFGQEPNVDFGPYMKNMQRNIKLNWTPPHCDSSSRTTVFYTIKKDGKLQKVSIFKSSGNKALDNSAIKAIKKTKFQPLPTKYDKETIDVQFTFDYNVHKK